MGLQMDSCVCFMLSLITIAFSNAEMDVKYVEVPRFGGDAPTCVPKQVCADVFNSTRTPEEGSPYREVRMLMNCKCDEDRFLPCGASRDQFVFRETTKQSMFTCEDASDFDVCARGDVAKEKHTGDHWRENYVYHVIKCVCPTNNNPRGFYQRMTRPIRGPFSQFVDFYTCRYF